MKKYSTRFKEAAVKKLLDNPELSTRELAEQLGISSRSLQLWRKKIVENNINNISPKDWNLIEKFNTILEAKSIPTDSLGKWLRKKGVHTAHLNLWEKEIKDYMKTVDNKFKKEYSLLKKENKQLKKELLKKEKALAEVSALLILKKKANLIWGEEKET